MTRLAMWMTAALGMLLSGAAWAAEEGVQNGAGQPVDGGIHFQRPVTPVARDIVWLDNFLHIIIIGIVALVTVLLAIVIVRYNRKANPTPSTRTHHAMLEVVWTAIPVIILIVIAVPSLKLLFLQLEVPKPDITIKATGVQWGWSYEYPDENISFDAYMIGSPQMYIPPEVEEELGVDPGNMVYALNDDVRKLLDHYGYRQEEFLLATDNRVVVPVNAVVHVLVTAGDVIHAWAIPSFGSKIDAIPGRINETWFKAEEVGTYFGQCSELCGQAHSYMPIVVEVVSQEDYDTWVLEMAARDGDGKTRVADAAATDAAE